MSRGFYKRRRGILEHLEAGTIDLIDLAIHDYLNLKANLLIGSPCSIPPGICITSAAAIHAISGGAISYKTIQRRLYHLEQIGWIKRFNTRGKHGNFPVLICRASVHDVSGDEYRINGEATTDWRDPKWIPVHEESARGEIAVDYVSSHREKRIENVEKKRTAVWVSPPADSRFQPLVKFAFEAFERKHRQKPTWGGKDYKSLSEMLANNKHLDVNELQERFGHYLASTEPFTRKQGGSLGYFCMHVDSFLDGPILANLGKRETNGNPNVSDNIRATLEAFRATDPNRPA